MHDLIFSCAFYRKTRAFAIIGEATCSSVYKTCACVQRGLGRFGCLQARVTHPAHAGRHPTNIVISYLIYLIYLLYRHLEVGVLIVIIGDHEMTRQGTVAKEAPTCLGTTQQTTTG